MAKKYFFGIIILIAIMAFGLNNRLTVRHYTVTGNGKIAEPLKIVAISDLHGHIFDKNQEELINKIKEQSPDFIFLLGDFVDKNTDVKGIRLLLKGISTLAPCYYVTGNHEIASEKVNDILYILDLYNVKVLNDAYEEIKIKNSKLIIAGINDSNLYLTPKKDEIASDIVKSFSELKNNTDYKILLSHKSLSAINLSKYGFDLMTAGHSHGGQVRIPFILNGLYAPNEGFFPKYAGGQYCIGNSDLIITRGLATNISFPRVFNPPEISVINILANN